VHTKSQGIGSHIEMSGVLRQAEESEAIAGYTVTDSKALFEQSMLINNDSSSCRCFKVLMAAVSIG